MKMRTWYFEYAVVGIILATVVIATGNKPIEWIGAVAVFFTFGHAAISFRMAEQVAYHEEKTGQTIIHCYRWSKRYFVMKEALWFTYFAFLGAWSAIVGVVIFLLYPLWRSYWRTIHPFIPESERSS